MKTYVMAGLHHRHDFMINEFAYLSEQFTTW